MQRYTPSIETLESRTSPSALSGLTNALYQVSTNASIHQNLHQAITPEFYLIQNISWRHTIWPTG